MTIVSMETTNDKLTLRPIAYRSFPYQEGETQLLSRREGTDNIRYMSYKLFDRGFSPEDIQKMKKEKGAEDRVLEELRRWRESEHILNILRKIRASEGVLDKMELEVWRKAVSGKF